MFEFPQVVRRALNVATILTSLWLVLLIFVWLMGGVSNWPDYIGKNVLPALGVCAVVGIAGYIFFGKFTLWHKVTGSRSDRNAA